MESASHDLFTKSHQKWLRTDHLNKYNDEESEINIWGIAKHDWGTHQWPHAVRNSTNRSDSRWAATASLPWNSEPSEVPLLTLQNSQKHQRRVISIYRNNVSKEVTIVLMGDQRDIYSKTYMHSNPSFAPTRTSEWAVPTKGGGSVFQFLSDHSVLEKITVSWGQWNSSRFISAALQCLTRPDSNSHFIHRALHGAIWELLQTEIYVLVL